MAQVTITRVRRREDDDLVRIEATIEGEPVSLILNKLELEALDGPGKRARLIQALREQADRLGVSTDPYGFLGQTFQV